MRKKIILLFSVLLLLFGIINGQSVAPVNVRIEASPEYAPGMIRANTPFTVDLFLDNYGAEEMPGVITALRFYSPDGILSVIPVKPDSGTVYLGNVALLNGFGEMGYWDLFNIVEGYSWDDVLPDTLFHFGVGFNNAWPAGQGEQLHYSFSFKIAEEGTFCIEWVDPIVFDTLYPIEFDDVLNFQSQCWSINDVGVCGDFNGDGIVNILDVAHIIRCYYPPDYKGCVIKEWIYDVNNDGVVNIFDITRVLTFLYLGGAALNCPPPPEP